MEQRPLLILPEATAATPPRRRGGGPDITFPSAGRQGERLGTKFERIREGFTQLAAAVDGLEPEFVVVFEANDSIEDVASAASKVLGLEWLAEWDLPGADQDADFRIDGKPDDLIPLRLFALSSNQAAIGQLIGLWNDWQREPDKRAASGYGPFKGLFRTLKDLRRWDARDRILDTGILECWREDLRLRADTMRFEVELWFRHDDSRRAAASATVARALSASGGRVVGECALQPIRYHGLLVECSREFVVGAIEAVKTLQSGQVDNLASLLICDDVMFLRPRAQAGVLMSADESDSDAVKKAAEVTGKPVVALLDGLPLERHHALDGLVEIDDPDDFASAYHPEQQVHGTSMASVLVHGDLASDEPPLPHPVHVRPVMLPHPDDGREEFPSDRLFVDLLHRAVRRMLVGEGTVPATAPTVRIINLSLGNPSRPFAREMSPLARLLDWLAWEHNVVFVVSAGNFVESVDLPLPEADVEALSDRDRVHAVLGFLQSIQSRRRLLSPAESLNAITVGAMNEDASQGAVDRDLLRGHRYPSPLSRGGLGYGGSVKPEILLPGGRQLYRPRISAGTDSSRFELIDTSNPPGTKVAAPGRAGSLSSTTHTRGTSVAAAHASRLASRILVSVQSLIAQAAPSQFSSALLPSVVKALLVHAARWGDPLEVLDDLTTAQHWTGERRKAAQFLGYGQVDPDLALFATERRVVLVGGGFLGKGQAHRYLIPMPSEMDGVNWRRRLVTTLAWMTPINIASRRYRKATLSLSGASLGQWFESTTQADDSLAGRGTVVHLVRESQKRLVLVDDAQLEIQVNCAEDAPDLTERVPYGLAITMEIAEPVAVDIQESVRARLAIPVRAQA